MMPTFPGLIIGAGNCPERQSVSQFFKETVARFLFVLITFLVAMMKLHGSGKLRKKERAYSSSKLQGGWMGEEGVYSNS